MTSVLQKLSRQKTQPQPAIALQTVENRDQGNAVPSISLTRPSLTISPPTSLLSDNNANTEKMRKSETESSAGIQFSDVVTSAFTTQSSLASSNSSTEICIYMMDNSGLTFNLDDGRTATADVILDLVLDELDIPSLYKPCFGIWISSSLLHLQLRPYHIPHRMAKHWGDLLVKFTLANLDQLEKDEPILRLQRNVFLSPSAELSIDHSEVLRLLYCEARENVLESLYPLDISDSYKLAGMASCHEYGSFSANDHDIGFYSDKIDPLLPEWIEKSNSAILGCSGSSFFARLFSRTEKVRGQLCLDLQRAHQEETNKFTVSRELQEKVIPEDFKDKAFELLAQRQYLKECYQLPFYGCAFFRGLLYKPSSIFTSLWNLDKAGSASTYPVTISVSMRGLCLLDLSTADHLPGTLLLAIPYSQLHWVTAELEDAENGSEPGLTLVSTTSPAVLPSIFLHFTLPNLEVSSNEPESLMLQVVSKQAPLVDALMQACVQLHRREFDSSSMPQNSTIDPSLIYGSGVNFTDMSRFPFDWRKEESFLNLKDGHKNQCLSTKLERLKLGLAIDFDD